MRLLSLAGGCIVQMEIDLLSLRENSTSEGEINMETAYGVISALIILLASCKGSTAPAWVVSNLAGSGTFGHVDGAAATARFNGPARVALDSSGDVYVAEYGNDHIRKITQTGGAWTVGTLAGSGKQGHRNGAAYDARFNSPIGVALDSSGNVYVADRDNHRIRKITQTGIAWTVGDFAGSGAQGHQDGAAASAQFDEPEGVAVDLSGNVYVADTNNHRIRKITKEKDGTWTVSTLAGNGTQGHQDGTGAAAWFYWPTGVALDSSDNVYVADYGNHRIRKITEEDDGTWMVSTIAGSRTLGHLDGAAATAQFRNPTAVALDSSGNVYVADENNHRIRKITEEDDGTWTVSTIAGSGAGGHQNGAGAAARFNLPAGVALDSSGNVYVAEFDNNRIRKITEDTGIWTVSDFAGSGTQGHQDGPPHRRSLTGPSAWPWTHRAMSMWQIFSTIAFGR